ncbi:MAG: phosphate uptake regulator PhoU [Thermoprotei archaeon]
MDRRRLQLMGRSSLVMSLPKQWVVRSGLKKGDVVEIGYAADGGLVVYPAEAEPLLRASSAKLEYTAELAARYVSDWIVSAYLMGANSISLRADSGFDQETRDTVYSVLRTLMGLEVVEESDNHLVAQFLVDSSLVQPKRVMKRLGDLAGSMLKDTLRQLKSSRLSPEVPPMNQRDVEVNRLYFLLVRLVRAALLNPGLASEMEVSVVDCLDYRVAAGSIENTADSCVRLASLGRRNPSRSRQLASFLESIEQRLVYVQENSTKALINRDYELSKRVLEEDQRVLEAVSLCVSRRHTPRDVLLASDLVRRIVDYQKDVADLVSPSYPPASLAE